jgi:DNA polymerase, archaea type
MRFEANELLFGHDPTERIMAVECEQPGHATLYLRQPDGSTLALHETFRPFMWSDAPIVAEGVTVRRLAGDLPLCYLAEFSDWQQFNRVRLSLRGGTINCFALSDPAQQFLLQTGKTLFKPMQFEELRRLQISVDSKTIALSDNSGWAQELGRSELEKLTAIIHERDPDVIEGHDLFKKTLPGLAAHARNAGVKLTWGRDGGLLTSRSSRIQIAEKNVGYPKFEAHGRHFVDTYLLAQFYDVSARVLEGYELRDVAEHFHLAEKCGSGAVSCCAVVCELTAALSASYFVQAKIFPYNYQEVVVRGNATKIDALLLREYYRREHSIPNLPEPRPFEGGYTDVFVTGIARNVWHCDVTSLYPSLMLRYELFPANDRLGIFRGLLQDVRKFRLEAKKRLRNEPSRGLEALQATFKILINSFYGYLGFAQAHFADFDAASRVTELGRELLKKMVTWLREHRAQVIEIDTDGIYFVPPPDQSVPQLQRGLETILPEGIEIELDAQYDAMFSYKAKNYALLSKTGELLMTGGALKSRGLEKFQRLFLERMIRLLMEGNTGRVAQLQADFEQKIRDREWPIEMLMKTETLQDSLVQYQKKIAASSRNRASAYELALKSGRNYQPGDQVSYYVTGSKKKVAAYDNSKLASQWDPKSRDENIEYYVGKLNELAKKFSSFIEQEQMSLL